MPWVEYQFVTRTAPSSISPFPSADNRSALDRADTAPAERAVSLRLPVAVSLIALSALAFALRALDVMRQSAYMDEAAQIMAGRLLIEQHTVYAGVLNWNYGSYLWPLVAGVADRLGGLVAVRLVTAALGVVMVLSTVFVASRLTPPDADRRRRWTVALIAGLIMAIFPTAIGVGRFGTYDSLAGAGFMTGTALLVPIRRSRRGTTLLLAALLLFVGFLAKYMLAIFFPFLCLYAMFGTRSPRGFIRYTFWFVLPLAACCALYFYIFRTELVYLLRFSTGYTDLRSATPLREYVLQRLDLWLLAGLALLSVRRATSAGRLVGLGGTAVLIGFQALARPDYDFWKHSIYAVYFLAPLAGLTLAPLVEGALASAAAGLGWREATGTERLVARGGALLLLVWAISAWHATGWTRSIAPFLPLALLAGLIAIVPAMLILTSNEQRRPVALRACAIGLAAGALLTLPLAQAEARARSQVAFFPNLNASRDAIRADVASSRRVLTDDAVMRYYLHGVMQYQRVTDPFYITYRGQQDMAGYRLAIGDRYFDTIVLDGGVGPLGQRLRSQLGDLITRNYQRVYQHRSGDGATVEIYRAREIVTDPTDGADITGSTTTFFDDGAHGWGAHPDSAELQPGLQVAISREHPWQNHASLAFTTSDHVSLAGTLVKGPVSRAQIDLYIVPPASQNPDETITMYVGLIGFDKNWQWHDNGFQQAVPTGRWNRLTWDLTQPGFYNEIGFKLPDGTLTTVYLGRVDVQP